MLATLVNASTSAVQVFALIAVILFIIAGIIALRDKTLWATLICAGLAFLSAAVMYLAQRHAPGTWGADLRIHHGHALDAR